MDADWTTLEEIGELPTTLASSGYEERAAWLQSLVRDAHRYLSESLGTDLAPRVIVASPADWGLGGDETPYGIPYATYEHHEVVIPADPSENFLVDTFAAFAPRESAERFADLIAVHELGHLHAHAMGLDLPGGWLTEFLASYLLYCFLAEHRPADRALWYELSRDQAARTVPVHRSLETLDELYFGVGADNYIWYQSTLSLMVDQVHAELGVEFVLRLRSAGLGPDSDGASMLAAAEQVHPGFDAWAASLRDQEA